MKSLQRCACVFAVLLGLCVAAFSQSSSTSLHGTVTDPSGSAIVGAAVVLSNDATKLERSATTGSQGDFQFLALSPGTYTLAVNAKGFKKYQQTALQLLVNTPATVNVSLKVGTETENITVTSEAPVLNLVDASMGNTFGENQVKEIPLEGRNVPDLLSLQPGVAYTGNNPQIADHSTVENQDTRNGAVNGARSDQSNITLDGIDVNDQSNGYAFDSVLPITQDSVQEFRVTTSNYNAEQGGGSGAQVALVTKSGTNAFHGAIYESHRNTITSANDFFVKQAEAVSGVPNDPPKLIRNIFGAAVGGPLKKDRAFFFLNYEGTRKREQYPTARIIPSVAMRDQVIMYTCADTNNDGSNLDECPGGGPPVQGKSGTNYPIAPGQFGVGPAQLKQMDPLGTQWGPSDVMWNYFNQTYGNLAPNDAAVGDGLNYVGYLFRAPIKLNNNAFLARLDYHLTADGKHSLFWRGNLQNSYNPLVPFLPGTPPEQTIVDHSKGFAFAYTAVLSPTKVNTFRWGFTRQSTGIIGDTQQSWNIFYGLDEPVFYTHNSQTPVHSFLDDFSWTRGRHTLQMGGTMGFARDPRLSYEHSFSLGKGATNWMNPTGFANTGSYFDPGLQGFPEPASSTQYDYPVLALTGMVSDIVANYNYDKTDQLLKPGDPVRRNYGLNWYEIYGQDAWKVKPNLTITYGLRWSLFPPPWEVNGFQASPICIASVNTPGPGCPSWASTLGNEFSQMAKNAQQGLGYLNVPLVSFQLGGKANNTPGFYSFEKSDFAPRVSFAYSPRHDSGFLQTLFGNGGKSVIRGGFAKVYDRAGLQLASTFDANAPGGLAATVQNLCCAINYDDAANLPRINSLADPNASINNVPVYGVTNQLFFQPNPQTNGKFPETPYAYGEAITWGIDQSLKTPYAYAMDLSFSRDLSRQFSLQVAYVGRLGRNLLTQRDLRQPIDLVDPVSKIDYFTAATALAKIAQANKPYSQQYPTLASYYAFINTLNDSQIGPTAKFWHDMIPALQNGATSYANLATGYQPSPPASGNPNDSLLPVIFDAYYDPALSYVGNEVVGLAYVDLYSSFPSSSIGDSNNNAYAFCNGPCGPNYVGYGATDASGVLGGSGINNQAASMYGWSSIGKSAYNALQVTLSKKAGNGIQFDLNYTYSKSIDITSGATRLGFSSSTNVGAPGSRLVNAWSPRQRRAVSDFDTTHQINANWVVELPFGKGKRYAAGVGSVLDAIVGGWQVSGLTRWTSGYPFTVDNGNFWATNWDEQGIAQMINRPKTGRYRQVVNGLPVFGVFPDSNAAWGNFQNPFPGQSGSRNVLRGDGYAGLDMALSKTWKMPWENHSLQFRWNVFNVPNLHRFNVQSGVQSNAGCACIASMQDPQTFGDYTGLLTQSRVMQFDLRYIF